MKKYIVVPLAAIFLVIAGIFIYIGNYYHASETAVALIETPAEGIHLIVDEEGRMIFEPETEAEKGIIFYPGGKVQAESYAPLLSALAEEGVLTVLVPMPANLAVLDKNGADGIIEEYVSIKEWYMAGHSLGGSMAAAYLADQSEGSGFAGLILLASYSTADFSKSEMNVLSIYGDCDQVLDQASYAENRDNLPEDTKEAIIKGGNHAQFGDYGRQEGDGAAKISPEEQLEQTVNTVTEFVGE